MKSFALSLVFAALAMHAVSAEVGGRRTLLNQYGKAGAESGGEASGGTKVYAAGTAKSTGGTVTVVVKSAAEAVAEAEVAIAKVCSEAIAYAKDGNLAQAKSSSYAQAIATAIARAFAATRVTIKSTGEGNSACGQAFASAEAAAEAFALAYARALAKAANDHSVAVAKADALAIASATARAFAQASSKGCVYGKGELDTFAQSFAESIVVAYADALAIAVSSVKGKSGYAGIHTEANSAIPVEKTFAATKTGTLIDIEDGYGFGKSSAQAKAETEKLEHCGYYPQYAHCCGYGDVCQLHDWTYLVPFGNGYEIYGYQNMYGKKVCLC